MFSGLFFAAFFFSPARSGGLSPVELTGDMRVDWQAHAETAAVCVADELPTDNILESWRMLGVKMLRRVRWNPEDSADYVRRKAGFLAVREGADGVWLDGEEKFSETWRQALREAEKDVGVVLYCKALAEEALQVKASAPKTWIEGRRALWLLRFIDAESENLDTMRLEFICFARRLEQLLGKAPKDLPADVAAPVGPNRRPFDPLGGRPPAAVPVALNGRGPVLLSEGLSLSLGKSEFTFVISSPTGTKADRWPGGKAAFKLHVPDGAGSFLTYEYQIDLSKPDAVDFAPIDGYGLWFLRERWGKGRLGLWADARTWRLKPVPHGSYGSAYPRLLPRYDFRWNDGNRPGWTVRLRFSWLDLHGFWPALADRVSDKWYVTLGELPGVPAAACRLDWERGRPANWAWFAAGIGCGAVTARYEEECEKVRDIARLWFMDRLYGYAKTETPTYGRFDFDSGKVFWERVVMPMAEADADLADITRETKSASGVRHPGKLEGVTPERRLAVCKALGRLLHYAERVSDARRDYMLMRFRGEMPPEPVRKAEKRSAASAAAPVLDDDSEDLQLDDKEF